MGIGVAHVDDELPNVLEGDVDVLVSTAFEIRDSRWNKDQVGLESRYFVGHGCEFIPGGAVDVPGGYLVRRGEGPRSEPIISTGCII